MTEPSDRHELSELIEAPHHAAEILFAVASFLFAIFLLTQIGNQTTWANGVPFVSQPGFWPIVSIVGMTVFGIFELWHTFVRNRKTKAGGVFKEVANWARAIEYAVWFMAYVWLVPLIGYLPVTLVFCVLLAFRLGYQSRRMILAAMATGLATVLVFKTLLSVKIPGAALYEFLPDGIRNVMIVYF